MSSIAGASNGRYSADIDAAHTLVDLGVPVFAGRIGKDGNPDRTDRRWLQWQNKSPSHQVVNKWKPGEALAAVCGLAFDVLDYDPRNGGDLSWKRLSAQLGDDGPDIYWSVATPSGGKHYYIAPLGVGTVHGFLPGLDLQGGKPDGSGRGFVFLPPTVRPSKATGEPGVYRQLDEIMAVNGDRGCEALRKIITLPREQEDTGQRKPASALKAAALAAEAGEQRTALLALVQEWERRGYEDDDIIELLVPVVRAMPAYDEKYPWYPARQGRPDAELRGLLHGAGKKPIADAAPGELEGLDGPERSVKSKLTITAMDMPTKIMTYCWDPYLPRGELIILDGEKGQGKTLVICHIAAKGSRGEAMPEAAEIEEPFNTVIFTYEGVDALKPRLIAAGADISRIRFINPDRPKKRGKEYDDPLALPFGAPNIANMIREADADLAIFDPITDFLHEDINSHNDASVRRALAPLGLELNRLGVSGLCIRHMNKNTEAKAQMRGTGSTAFQNRARVHLVAGELDPSSDGTRHFGLAMADANDIRRIEGALAYTVVDSDIVMDNTGRKVPKLQWDGYTDITLAALVRGPDLRHQGHGGRKPMAQEAVEEILLELFPTAGVRSAQACLDALRAAECSTAPSVLKKARDTLGIRVYRKRGTSGTRIGSWTWERV